MDSRADWQERVDAFWASFDDRDAAVSVALAALATYLPRYGRSVARYALALVETPAP